MGAFVGAICGGFLLLLLSGMWVGIACAVVGLGLMYIDVGWANMLQSAAWVVWGSANTFTLACIPLFIFMGLIFT